MKIGDKLDFWKKRLLDLGKRNRLINCPLASDGKRVQRHSLLISKPTSTELWELLAERDGKLSFPLPVEDYDELGLGPENSGQISVAHAGTGIKTNQSEKEANKTLRGLMKKAKEFTEEKGLNALHLAFGFLNWKENGAEGQEMRSPLLLLPVKLEQEDLFSPIILSRSDEEVSANHSLEQKLLSDFNIELPVLTEETDPRDYLHVVSQTIKSMGWSVSDDSTQLSLFSFMKINMYQDLEHNADKICSHHIVRAINGEPIGNDLNLLGIDEHDHDSTEPQEVFSVVDADSSQQDAILLAKNSASFILQGPPGTGKSQTITNIIAELIAEGKRVLFVSEKMAALEVVYKRLTLVDLNSFCLTLHSHNAKRREILDQLDNSIKMSRSKIELKQDVHNRLYHLKETRNVLNKYNAELHTVVEPIGKTIFQINGFLAQLEDSRNIDFVQENSDAFTPQLLAQCESTLEEVTRIVAKSGYQQDNPWNGCVLTQPPTFEFRQRFLVDAANLAAQVKDGISILKETNDILDNAHLRWFFSAIPDINRIFDCAKRSPKVNPAWILLDIQSSITNLDACAQYISECNSLAIMQTELDTASVKIRSAVQNGEVACYSQTGNSRIINSVAAYNDSLGKFQSQSAEKIAIEKAKDDIENKLRMYSQSYAIEKSKNDKANADWQVAYYSLLERCAESILTLDVTGMLSRYRSDFRSWTRIFSSTYRNDRKSLLVHCKSAEKLTYEQGLLLLDAIDNVQSLKTAFDKQTKITNTAKALLDTTDTKCKRIAQDLHDVTEALPQAEKGYGVTKDDLIRTLADVLPQSERQLAEKKQQFSFTQHYVSLSQDLNIGISESTDFTVLRAKLEWCAEFQKLATQYRLGGAYIAAVCECDSLIFSKADTNKNRLNDWVASTTPEMDKFTVLFDEQEKQAVYHLPLKQLLARITACKDNFASLEYLIDYRTATERLKSLGIDTYLEKAKEIDLGANEIIPVFKKCFYRSWLDAVLPKYSSVSEFRHDSQNERVKEFKELDKFHLEISKFMLVSKLVSRLPNFDTYSSSGEMALLRREMAKRRKLMPTRLLIAALPNLLPALKPCVMMSPLSVSTYLGSSNFEFDTVIFDEASQVRTEDAIGAIFRAKQAIIVGDSKQLPPTDFFSASMSASDEYEEDEEGEINDAGAYESLLDEATMLPTQTLLWHYRSRHEHLIAFSNAKIYQGNLITFPSAVEKVAGMGVEYVYVKGGFYDRGGRNGNKAEADIVAKLVFKHFQDYPNRSLGIIAFGEMQQSAIQDALITNRRDNLAFEHFFKEDKEESLFIKNLETVQGDERDTIIFSIGYAPDATGKFIMNFGPLSREGGERRLNVAVTRARYNLKLVGSIMPTDIDAERTSGQGPKLLRLYIDFAHNGANAILGEVMANDSLRFDSPFETSVYDFLAANGFDVATQVGCSGYRIDMAVRHPKYKGRFAIGIECDGAMYHSARTARERDRLRQTVLEDMGWNIYRVWSTDWIKDRRTEGERLLQTVKRAIDNYREVAPTSVPATLKMTDLVNVHTQSEDERRQEGVREKSKMLRSRYYGYNAKDIPPNDFAEIMLKVITNDYGLDKVGLFKETALYGYGWERQGNVIKKKFEIAYDKLIKQNHIKEYTDGKIKLRQ
jgi:very-short-patch-repair endonuclease